MKVPFGLRRDDGHSRWVLAGHKNGRWARLSAARQRPLSVDHPRGLRRSMHTSMSGGTAMWSAAVDEPCWSPAAWLQHELGEAEQLQSGSSYHVNDLVQQQHSVGTPESQASLDIGRWRSLWIRCLAGMFLFDSSASRRKPHIVWTLATRRVRWFVVHE